MTGYGRATRSLEDIDITIEIKTVNSRYLDLNPRLPKELSFFEAELRQQVQSVLNRGRVDVYVNLNVRSSDQYELNDPLVRNYITLAEKVRLLGLQGSLDVGTILQLPGALVPTPADYMSERFVGALTSALRGALEGAILSRQTEGAALRKEIEGRLVKLSGLTKAIADQAEQLNQHHREKLARRIQELTGQPAMDENRLAQELIYYAERSDIAEETLRLRSHMDQFEKMLQNLPPEGVGRRLDFLCQEMGREINTILAKSTLPAISELAVEGKAEIERIREQVQNVE